MINFRPLISPDFCFALIYTLICVLLQSFPQAAFSCRIINPNARLHIVNKDVKTNALSIVLQRIGFHLHAVRQQIIPLKNRRYAVQHMVVCFSDVICDHIFKREHPLYIHIARSGYEIFLICIFRRKLIANQMTAVIKVFAVHNVILYGMPSGRLDFSDISALLCRHQICSDVCKSRLASSKRVQLSIRFKRRLRPILFRKIRLVFMNDNIRLAAVFRYVRKCIRLLFRSFFQTAGRKRDRKTENGPYGNQMFFYVFLHDNAPFLL